MTNLAVSDKETEIRVAPGRSTVPFFVVGFILSWMLSIDQYAFFPVLAAWAIGQACPDIRKLRLPISLTLPFVIIATLACFAWFWSEYLGNAVRTANVWITGLLVVAAIYNAGRPIRSVMIRVLLWIWILSLSIYAVGLMVPSFTDGIMSLKVRTPLSSSFQLSTPSLFFEIEIARPIGFALYANELALFGLIVSALYIYHERVQSKRLVATLVVLSATGLILSTSRSIILTYVVITLLVVGLRLGSRGVLESSRVAIYLVTIPALIGLLTIIFPSVWNDVDNALAIVADARYGASAQLREMSYSQGLELFAENRITGVGGLPSLAHIQVGSHSLPVSIAVRHGVIGLLALVSLLGTAAVVAIRSILKGAPGSARLGAAIIISVVVSATIQFDDDVLPFVAFAAAIALLAFDLKGENNAV